MRTGSSPDGYVRPIHTIWETFHLVRQVCGFSHKVQHWVKVSQGGKESVEESRWQAGRNVSFISAKMSEAVLIVRFFCYILFHPKKSTISLSVMVNLSPVYVSYKSSGALGVFARCCLRPFLQFNLQPNTCSLCCTHTAGSVQTTSKTHPPNKTTHINTNEAWGCVAYTTCSGEQVVFPSASCLHEVLRNRIASMHR